MKVVIYTQVFENYAFNEDGSIGKGKDAYWKAKGGDEYVVTGIWDEEEATTAVMVLREQIERLLGHKEKNMYVANDFGKVRIVHDGSPFDTAYDVKVEWLVDGKWELYHGFNSLSDDYAFTNSREAAGRAIKKLAAQSAAMFEA